LIHPSAQSRRKPSPGQKPGTAQRVRHPPITQAQIDAANALHARLPTWAATDRAFERLKAHFGWDLEGCILKAAAINDLYSTRVYAVWRMSEHLKNVMTNPTADTASCVKEIACLPGSSRRHWSFASKIAHFFIDHDRYPIYDSFCRTMIAYHLGKDRRKSDPDNPYQAFIENLTRLREDAAFSGTLRELDRYLWLAGQYRAYLREGKRARLNAELRALFQADDPEIQRRLHELCPGMPVSPALPE
jgi:hypothetical protein